MYNIYNCIINLIKEFMCKQRFESKSIYSISYRLLLSVESSKNKKKTLFKNLLNSNQLHKLYLKVSIVITCEFRRFFS